MTITSISDTHKNKYSKVKFDELQLRSDLLIHAGDFSPMKRDCDEEVKEFLAWFSSQSQKYKILIGGNHDFIPFKRKEEFLKMIPSNIIYLENSGIVLDGYNIWGSPNVLDLPDWAFSSSEEELKIIYKKIPKNTDILITHQPPFGILDNSSMHNDLGSRTLLKRVKELSIKINIFGHIHHSQGTEIIDGKIFANTSVNRGESPLYFDIKNKPHSAE